MEDVTRILEESRARERAQTTFYRALASLAEARGDEATAERLNALLADEQHHLARLTARLLEMNTPPRAPTSPPSPPVELDGWEDHARGREAAEVAWYEEALAGELDPDTRELLKDILESEGHHARELGGKWMSA